MAKKLKQVVTAPETHDFDMHPRLLYDVILRQAGTLHKAVLEGIMNAIDAGATEVTVMADAAYLSIYDNGTGITDKDAIMKYWRTFGQPPEANEKKTYGYFRMGRGQLFAFGVNTWRTGQFEMQHVDVKHRGTKFDLHEHPESKVAGCQIDIALYTPLTPLDIGQLLRELEVSVKYVSVPIIFNDQYLSKDPTALKWDHTLDEAYIKLRDNGNLNVYNLGVLVCSHAGHVFGCGGDVVSRKQLKVNFARNEVMSDCPVWKKVKPIVNQRAASRVSKQPALTDAGRQRIANQLLDGECPDNLLELRIITDVTGRHWALGQLRSHEWNNTWSDAPQGNQRGDKIMQNKLGFVVGEATLDRFRMSDSATLLRLLSKYRDTLQTFRHKHFAELAPTLNEQFDIVPESQYHLQEQLVLQVLRYAYRGCPNSPADGLSAYFQRRKLLLGESPVANGWTDGSTYVAISRDYIRKQGIGIGAWAAYGTLLIHELCHDDADAGSHIHTPEFYAKYHEWSRTQLAGFVARCLQNVPRAQVQLQKRATKQQLCNQTKVEQAQQAAAAIDAISAQSVRS
jgi:hypothetical protein